MARELALSGRRFTAAEALQIGFVSKVVAGSRQDLICDSNSLVRYPLLR